MKKGIYVIAAMVIMFASSCEKTYDCKCSVAKSEEDAILPVTALTKAGAEVKCMENNTADPTTEGYYNCTLKDLAAP